MVLFMMTFGGNCVRTFSLTVRVSNNLFATRWHKLSHSKFHSRGALFTTTTSLQKISLKTVDDFKRLTLSLGEKEMRNLEEALRDNKSDSHKDEVITTPSNHQLRQVFLQAGLPFIGFGFLDNVVMILAGEYIDMTIGVALGISTMAAAAIGNLISDLLGLGLADSVEALCRTFGLPNPNLSLSQMGHTSVRWAQRLGRVLGVTIGCIIGMAPLLWFDHHDKEETK